MKVLDIPKSGKCGDRVWQRNRYCQYSYAAFVPFNPRSPAQVEVRQHFHAVSARWRTLSQEQRDVWIAVASTKQSKPRLFQCGVLPGFNLFVKTNVPLANQGKTQVDLPLEHPRSPKRAVSGLPVPFEGRSKHEECRNMPRQAVLGVCGGVSVSKPSTGRRGTPLRYRTSTIVPPYHHRSNSLAGRCIHRRPQDRLRFPCRAQPPRRL